MSTKRQATTDLNHDNWDKEDSNEEEETGGFKMAPKEVLEKRVIRTAKRRSQVPKGAGVFSGFSGFNKVEKSSFDFLANLTNGSQSNNQSTSPKSDTATVSSSSVITKSASNPSSGIFSLSGTSTPITKSVFSQPISESKTFVGLGSSPTFTQSIFGTSKPDSTVKDSPLKEQSSVSAESKNTFSMRTNANSDKPICQVSSSLFGVSPSTNANNTLFTVIATTSGNTKTSPFSTVKDSPLKEQSSVSADSKNTFSMRTNANSDKPICQVSSSLFGVSPSTNVNNTLFTGIATTSGNTNTSPFSTVKDSPLKEQSSVSADSKNTFSMRTNANSDKPICQVSSSLFGVSPSTNVNNSLFTGIATTSGNTNTSPFSTVKDSPLKEQSSVSAESKNTFSMRSNANSDKSICHVSSTLFGVSPSTNANNTLFTGIATTSGNTNTSPFSTVKDSPLKEQSSVSAESKNAFSMRSTANSDKPISQVSSTLFGVSPSTNANNTLFTGIATTSGNTNTLPFSSKTNNQTLFKTSVTSSTPHSSEAKKPDTKTDSDDKKLIYYNNLKGLNVSVSAWIKKHVEETPLCILSPIFRDYEKHLKNINDDYEKSKEQPSVNIADTKHNTDTVTQSMPVQTEKCFGSRVSTTLSNSLFSNNTMSSNTPFLQTISKDITSFIKKTTSTFTFGINKSTTVPANIIPTTVVTTTIVSTTVVPSTGFSFGIKNSSSTSSPFAISANDSGKTPFSFGIGRPFAFNSNIKTKETVNEDDKEDEPPKVEYKPITEDNSVYDKKCKIFVKKDGNFVDKGVGTLYIKKIEEGGKYQLLVRANTSLGNVLINMILSSLIPTQRMGKNNVMMVCMPTPDAKPPPTSILIRVKTSEDADELLETLNKYKT